MSVRADWYGTKGIWVDRVLYLLCVLELWPWPWIFKWVWVGDFPKLVATSTMWAGHKFFMATTGDVWIIPSFLIWWLCAACWAHFMCHHKLWPTSVSHPFSFLNNFLGLAWEKHYLKITIPIYRLVLQNFANPGYFPFLSVAFFLLTFFWLLLLQYVTISVQGISWLVEEL